MTEKICPTCGKTQPLTQFELLNCAFCGNNLDMEDIFVCGGSYRRGTSDVFLLVRPSDNDLPYVTKKKGKRTLFNLTKHHSHLYRVISEKVLVLVEQSWEAEYAGVLSPVNPVLDDIVSHHLKNALDKGDFLYEN